MYTPQEVSEKTFPKSTGLTSGYNMTAVDEFLDGLTEDYTALYKDNTTLKAKLKMLAEKVEEYRATEDAMRSTLLAAQKMAAQMVADAQAEKEKTIADAQAQAEQILADARGEADVQARQLQQEIRDSWEKLATAQSETADFIQRSRDLCAQQLAFLDSLPERAALERNAPEQEDQEPENEAVTLPAPEENAVPVADAEPVPSGGGPPAGVCRRTGAAAGVSGEEEEESPFPLDFKLNLEDLQFGRNYNGGDRR
ncbi:MAG: DivIVA domain-containing protein [Oscillospiraceae bacterium]